VLAQRKVLETISELAVQLLPERYPGYQVAAVKQLGRVIQAQATSTTDSRRQNEVVGLVDALAAEVGRLRGADQ
jgi:hypothetical protein